MSPFPFVLRLAVLGAILIAPAASGQPAADPAALQQASTEPDRAGSAPGGVVLPTQEGRTLGRPEGLLDLGGGDGSRRSTGGPRALLPQAGEIARVGWALGGVVALLLVLRIMLRKLGGPLAGGGRPSGVLEVLARYPIARAQQLVLLRLSGRVVLLHQSKMGMTTLSEVSDPDEVASLLARVESAGRAGPGGGFSTLLDRLLVRGGPGPDDELARAVGPKSEHEGKEVVDLTRRPRHRRSAGGGGR